MARTLLLIMPKGVSTPAAEMIAESTLNIVETITLTEGDGTDGTPFRTYTGTIDVGTPADTYLINLKSGSNYIGGDRVIVAATDNTTYRADSVKLDLSGTSVNLTSAAIAAIWAALTAALTVPGSIGKYLVDEIANVLSTVTQALTYASASATSAASADAKATQTLDRLDADWVIDKDVTPWQVVLIKRGTGELGAGTEIYRQDLQNIDGGPVTDINTFLGRRVTPS